VKRVARVRVGRFASWSDYRTVRGAGVKFWVYELIFCGWFGGYGVECGRRFGRGCARRWGSWGTETGGGGASGLYAVSLEGWGAYGDGLGVLRRGAGGCAAGFGDAYSDDRWADCKTMFGETPRELFRVHDWRRDIVTLGEVPGEFVRR
jgi:hypothetical protein